MCWPEQNRACPRSHQRRLKFWEVLKSWAEPGRISPAHLLQQMAQLTGEREGRRSGGRRGSDWKQIRSPQISPAPRVSKAERDSETDRQTGPTLTRIMSVWWKRRSAEQPDLRGSGPTWITVGKSSESPSLSPLRDSHVPLLPRTSQLAPRRIQRAAESEAEKSFHFFFTTKTREKDDRSWKSPGGGDPLKVRDVSNVVSAAGPHEALWPEPFASRLNFWHKNPKNVPATRSEAKDELRFLGANPPTLAFYSTLFSFPASSRKYYQ